MTSMRRCFLARSSWRFRNCSSFEMTWMEYISAAYRHFFLPRLYARDLFPALNPLFDFLFVWHPVPGRENIEIGNLEPPNFAIVGTSRGGCDDLRRGRG